MSSGIIAAGRLYSAALNNKKDGIYLSAPRALYRPHLDMLE
jgi:hypothetical protein